MPLPLALLGGFLLRQGLMAGGRAIAGRAIQSGATNLARRYLGNNAAGAVSKVIGVGRTGMAAKGLKGAHDAYKTVQKMPGEAVKKALKQDDEEKDNEQQDESTNIRGKFYSELDDLITIPEGNQGKSARLKGLRRMKKQNKQEVVESTDKIEELSKKTLQSYIKKAVQYVRSSTPAGEKTIYKGGTGGTDKPEAIGTRKGKLRKVRGSQIHKAQKKADAQVEHTEYLRDRIFRIAESDVSMTQKWLGYLANRGAGALGHMFSGIRQGASKKPLGPEDQINVRKSGLLNTAGQLVGRGVGMVGSGLTRGATMGFKQGQRKATKGSIINNRDSSFGTDIKGSRKNLISQAGQAIGRGAGWLYGKATKKHDLKPKGFAAGPWGGMAENSEILQKLKHILTEAKKSGRQIRKERQERRRHAMTQMKHIKKTGIGWPEAADKETAERRFQGFMKGSEAKIRKSQNRNAQKQEESSTNWKDRIVDILLESYLHKLDEARPGGSVEKLRYKLKLAPRSNQKDKQNPFGRDARAMDAAAMRAARNPNSEASKTIRQIHRDARTSEEPPSRGGKSRRSREEEHPSETDSERNYGHRFNKSRTGY